MYDPDSIQAYEFARGTQPEVFRQRQYLRLDEVDREFAHRIPFPHTAAQMYLRKEPNRNNVAIALRRCGGSVVHRWRSEFRWISESHPRLAEAQSSVPISTCQG